MSLKCEEISNPFVNEDRLHESDAVRAEVMVGSLDVSIFLLEGYSGTKPIQEVINILKDKDFNRRIFLAAFQILEPVMKYLQD